MTNARSGRDPKRTESSANRSAPHLKREANARSGRDPKPVPAAPPASQRDRLMSRQLPTLTYPLQMTDPSDAVAALQEVQASARQVLIAHGTDSAEWEAAQASITAAQAKVEACYEQIVFTALPPEEYEALVAAHPPTAEQAAAGEGWHTDQFPAALLQACADSDMTVDDWALLRAERLNHGEREQLWLAVWSLNARPRAAESLALPKGWTATLS